MSEINETEKNQDSDEELICDLDALTTKKVTFTVHGKKHTLLPITTRVFAQFWNKVLAFQNNKRESVVDQNQDYLETIRTLCKTLTLQDVERMTLMQKSLLIEALTRKVVGDHRFFETSKEEPRLQKNQKKKSNSRSAWLN